MSMLSRLWRMRNLRVFLIALAAVFALDLLFGDTNYDPHSWLSHLWFAETVAFALTGLIAALLWKRRTIHAPWILAAVGVYLLAAHIVAANIANGYVQPDRYNNPIGKIYEPLESTIPYNTPFNQEEKDYSLESSYPEFVATQVFVAAPFLIGCGITTATIKYKK